MVVDGEKLANKILDNIRGKINKRNLHLQLDILYIEKNAASEIYLTEKKEAARKVGIKVNIHTFERKTPEAIVKATCNNLNIDPNCTGYFIQLPISSHLNKNTILNFIDPAKDVDCLTPTCLGNVLMGNENVIKTAAVEAIISILKHLKLSPKSKVVTIVNDSNLIGKPLSAYLLSKGATVVICNEFTKDLANFTKQADILVAATGKAGLITGNMVQKGSCIIDAGISKVKGKTVGDVDFEPVSKIAKAITPVPGGVGPLTVACLMQNLLKIYEAQQKRPKN